MTQRRRGVRPPVIDDALADELKQFKGEWVAVKHGHVVASGQSATQVIERARDKSVDDPLVFRVPRHPERTAYYSLRGLREYPLGFAAAAV